MPRDSAEKCEVKSLTGMIPEERKKPGSWKTNRSFEDQMFWWPVPVLWKKNEEAEMIKGSELALYQSRESRTKKKRLSVDSVSPYVCIS